MTKLDKKANEVWEKLEDLDYKTYDAGKIKTSFELQNPVVYVTVFGENNGSFVSKDKKKVTN